jgi:glycosyltransferase involved in cell wall biosynthesis
VGDGPERKSLEALVGELKVTGMVTFAGSRRQEEVRGIMRRASLFALACVQGKDGQQDGIPIVLMEAMALGVPVVSTRLSGIPELVKDGQTGLLARPGDPQHLALAMERLLQDDALAASLRRDARTWVTIEFDLDRWVGQLSEALAEAHRP